MGTPKFLGWKGITREESLRPELGCKGSPEKAECRVFSYQSDPVWNHLGRESQLGCPVGLPVKDFLNWDG